MARPSKYSEKLTDDICERIATTPRGLDFICDNDDALPSARTVHGWLNKYPSFRQSYLRARERQAALLMDECLVIADDASGDVADEDQEPQAHGGSLRRMDPSGAENIQRSKLRCDVRMRMAGKLDPKRWGERQTVEHTDPAGGNPFAGLMEAIAANGRPRPSP